MTKQELNKACAWLEKYMESLGYIDEWCRDGEDTFRKDMGAVIKESLTTELTWQDMAKIADIIGHTAKLTHEGITRSPEEFYTEVLQKFNKG